jgi:hypothetical protein
MTKLPNPEHRPARGASDEFVHPESGAPHSCSGCAALALCGLTNPAAGCDRPAEVVVGASPSPPC